MFSNSYLNVALKVESGAKNYRLICKKRHILFILFMCTSTSKSEVTSIEWNNIKPKFFLFS